MSQKKVDAYKAEKANREKIMKKEKLILNLEEAGSTGCMYCCRVLDRLFCIWEGDRGSGDRDHRDCYGYFSTGFLSEWTER